MKISDENWINRVPLDDQDLAIKSLKKAKTDGQMIKVLHNWHPDGYLNLSPVKSLDEYLKIIRFTANNSTWFRGQTKDYGSLIPKLYRSLDSNSVEDLQKLERKLFVEFKRRASSLNTGIQFENNWSWYFLIQHYGGPTRLLDWTSDASVALFFALEKSLNSKENPVVITLQATTLVTHLYDELGLDEPSKGTVIYPGEYPSQKWIANITNHKTGNGHSIPNNPIALLPPYSDLRIKAQKSCFTLFGNLADGFSKHQKLLYCSCCSRRTIHKITIDRNERENILKQLSRIGINTGDIYPGLEGLSKELSNNIFS